MLKNYIIILLITLSLPIYGQQYSTESRKAIKQFVKAKGAYNQKLDMLALSHLKNAVNIDTSFVEAYLLMTDIYNLSSDYKKVIELYKIIVSIAPEQYPASFFNLADAQLKIGNYDAAIKNIKVFLSLWKVNDNLRNLAEYKLDQCNFIISSIKNPVKFEPKNLGKSINSDKAEYLPAITIDDQLLIFTICADGGNGNCQEDFYYCKREAKHEWSKAEDFGYPVNTELNEGGASISADGQILFFTACDRRNGFGNCDIYYSLKNGEGWSEPQNLGRPVNSRFWESQPSFSSDGRTLYFSSDRPGGFGGKDIWKSTLTTTGLWSKPVNLGSNINTKKSEMAPFIHPDNKTLYFSSDGHLGMGGMDLFISRLDSKRQWRIPENMGYPINTFENETDLIINANGDKAYFASDRPEGFGKSDIYEFKLPKKIRPERTTYVKGIVYDAESKKKLESYFELINLKTGKIAVEAYSNAITGEFLVCLPSGNYALNIAHKGYLFYSEHFALKDSLRNSSYKMDVPLQPISEGKKIVLKNIFFETDSYQLKKESHIELNKLVNFLKSNPETKIEIGGHTDDTGDEKYNLNLSKNRSKSVYNYLIKKNIDETLVIYKGYGFSQPLITSKTDKARAKNRRTEIKILN